MVNQERRRNKRFPLTVPGYAIINGSSVDLATHDISQDGALVQLNVRIALRSKSKLLVRLNIGFMGLAKICRLETLAHHTLYGLKFERFDHHSDLLLIAYLLKHERYQPGHTPIQ